MAMLVAIVLQFCHIVLGAASAWLVVQVTLLVAVVILVTEVILGAL